MDQPTEPTRQIHITISGLSRRQLLFIGGGALASILLAAIAILYINTHTGLNAIAGKIDSFTPYYFRHNLPPDGYTVDKSRSQYNNGILELSLIKGEKTIVLTEQTAPAKLDQSILQGKGGTSVKDAPGPAFINLVEGRVVGAMLPSGSTTLIIVNAPSGADSGDVSDLLKALRPAS